MTRAAGGRFFVDAGQALFVGKVFETTRRAHHAIQVCADLEGPVRFRVQADGLAPPTRPLFVPILGRAQRRRSHGISWEKTFSRQSGLRPRIGGS